MRSALLLSTVLLAGTAQADILGLTAEVGSYSPDVDSASVVDHKSTEGSSTLDGKSGTYYGIAFEHPIPIIPNVRLQGTELESSGTITSSSYNGSSVSGAAAKLDLSHTDFTLYYEFLDGLFWLDLDAGVTLRKIDGSVTVDGTTSDLSDTQPLGYVSAYVTLPGTSLSLGGEVKTGGFDGSSITDTTFKAKYEFPVLPIGIEGGYRTIDMDLDDISGKDINSKFSGVFIGAFVDF